MFARSNACLFLFHLDSNLVKILINYLNWLLLALLRWNSLCSQMFLIPLGLKSLSWLVIERGQLVCTPSWVQIKVHQGSIFPVRSWLSQKVDPAIDMELSLTGICWESCLTSRPIRWSNSALNVLWVLYLALTHNFVNKPDYVHAIDSPKVWKKICCRTLVVRCANIVLRVLSSQCRMRGSCSFIVL